MDYETLNNIGEFVVNYSGWFLAGITGGAIVGLAAFLNRYDKTRPIVEGEVIDSNFTNEDKSTVRIRTEEEGCLDLLLDTKKFEGVVSIRVGCGTNYRGRADELKEKIPIGMKLRAKVAEKNGLERNVYELLGLYAA